MGGLFKYVRLVLSSLDDCISIDLKQISLVCFFSFVLMSFLQFCRLEQVNHLLSPPRRLLNVESVASKQNKNVPLCRKLKLNEFVKRCILKCRRRRRCRRRRCRRRRCRRRC